MAASRLDLTRDLNDAGRGASGTGALWRRGHGLRRLLVVAEIALAVVLLVGAALVVRSVVRLAAVPPGFDPAGVLTFELTMQGQRYAKGADGHLAYRELWRRIAALPGVEAAGAISALPLSQMFAWGPIVVEGRTRAPGEAFINADMRFVDGEYFRGDADPARRGPAVRRRRSAAGAAGRARRRAHGGAAVAGSARRSAGACSWAPATTRTRRGSRSSASSAA